LAFTRKIYFRILGLGLGLVSLALVFVTSGLVNINISAAKSHVVNAQAEVTIAIESLYVYYVAVVG